MAIEEVNQIINALQDTLDDMEEVREMLEVFERQANADDREIESLRRALRHLQRPRDGGQSQRGHS
jgi:predicted RNase H-like nuclease (RuvC/YqgF family)